MTPLEVSAIFYAVDFDNDLILIFFYSLRLPDENRRVRKIIIWKIVFGDSGIRILQTVKKVGRNRIRGWNNTRINTNKLTIIIGKSGKRKRQTDYILKTIGD